MYNVDPPVEASCTYCCWCKDMSALFQGLSAGQNGGRAAMAGTTLCSCQVFEAASL